MQDRLLNAVGIPKNFVVPESKDAPATLLKPSRSAPVTVVVSMLATIRLDDQPMLDTGEIDNKRTERVLAPKFGAAQAPAS